MILLKSELMFFAEETIKKMYRIYQFSRQKKTTIFLILTNNKGLESTIVNHVSNSLNKGSGEITPIVPLSLSFKCISNFSRIYCGSFFHVAQVTFQQNFQSQIVPYLPSLFLVSLDHKNQVYCRNLILSHFSSVLQI